MRVLFISSGNSSSGISPIVLNQGNSIADEGIDIFYFTIKGKGVVGYLKNVPRLRKYLHQHKFDIIHAHYSLSAFVASISGAKPLVVSLMGSDVKAKKYFKNIIQFFKKISWKATIVKSSDMKVSLGFKDVIVIPNGVDFGRFKPLDRNLAIDELRWDKAKKHIFFAANPERYEKNFSLAKESFDLIEDTELELHVLNNVPNELMPVYYNASDVVVLTSLWEGSPNVIKEALACNRPIVSTDVGDVAENLQNVNCCHVTAFDKYEIAEKIQFALNCAASDGRVKIDHLNSKAISGKLISIYHKIIHERKN